MAKSSRPTMVPGVVLALAIIGGVFVDWNPLNVTFGGLSNNTGFEFTEQLIHTQNFVDWPVKHINDFSEAKITHQLEMYQVPDEYLSNICPDLDAVNKDMKNTNVTVNHYYDVYGANAVGCKNMEPEDIVYPGKMPANMSMSFYSSLLKPDALPATVKDKRIKAVSGFISYYEHPYLSAPMHAASVASIAIQCVGEKVWGFHPPKANKKWGLRSFFGGVLSRGIDGDADMIIVKTKPGTLLVFPAFWAHWVLTKPGPNFMYTPRIPMILTAFYRHKLSLWNTISEIVWDAIKGKEGSSSLDRAVKENDDAVLDLAEKPCANEITLENLKLLMAKLGVDWPLNWRR